MHHALPGRLSFVLSLLLFGCTSSPGAAPAPVDRPAPSGIGERTAGLASFPGLLTLHWDEREAQLLFEVPDGVGDLLYTSALARGLGSNDVGLDRGQLGTSYLVRFRPVGDRVLLVAPNVDWRTSSADEAVGRAVRDSFAESVLFAFPVVAREHGRLLVDGTEFFLRDAHGVARSLADARQGEFQLDAKRSAIDGAWLRSFPENTEVEAYLTFGAERPGAEVRATAPDPRAVTLRTRHSFVRLPELEPSSFSARRFHPGCGYFPLTWRDLSRPIDEEQEVRWIERHRLIANEGIVYHVDRGAPEPVRTALLEGARYWVPVFAAAGFPGGFRVELLPEDADPLDLRYNVIQWVNRSTRGWSYGRSVTDPRTGEILKGHVSLGALRVRQDVRILEGLLAPYAAGDTADPRVVETALDRIRQLSAHEVGHTLGLAHNFAASVDGRASVMDYPAPLVRVAANGSLDVSEAYRDGCGEWDELTILYGYGDHGTGDDEERGLREVLGRMDALHYLTDRDARGTDRAHPLANLWDNGEDALDELQHTLRVRAVALSSLSERALRPGRPQAALEDVLVPLYLHHRYQLEAAARLVGGVWYDYSIVGEGEATPQRPVDAQRQRAALRAVLLTLRPAFLRLPTGLEEQLLPPPPGSGRGPESFQPGGLVFDELQAVRASAAWTLALLLDPGRAQRLSDQAARDPDALSWSELLDELALVLWAAAEPDPRDLAIQVELQELFLDRVTELVRDAEVAARVRAPALRLVQRLYLAEEQPPPPGRGLTSWQRERVRRFLEEPWTSVPTPARPWIPPGPPIGAFACETPP